ncbi:MAG TPA: AAA domain-containing protein [Candidatus Limnocylindrales bacterium]|nr:AAA domain-containing protein [Candidatus Limnocylindrales bacterium]
MNGAAEEPAPWSWLHEDRLQEYCRIRHPREFSPTVAEQVRIGLSYLPTRGFVAEADLSDVAADLGEGLVMEERAGDRGSYYVLSGSRYDVFANPGIARDGQHAIADVSSVKSRQRLSRRSTVRPASVSFHDKREEAYCDLANLLEMMTDGLSVVRRRLTLKRKLAYQMRSPDLPAQPLGDLRVEIHRHYAPLRMMLDLIAQRARLEGAVEGTGVVEGQRMDEVYIRVAKASGEFAESRPVELTCDGRQLRTRLQSIEEHEGDTILCVVPPRSMKLASGAKVALRQDGRFAWRRHREALDAFLAGQVEGDWEHLMLLLCRPEQLPPYSIRRPSRYFTEASGRVLNEEQRDAVAGGLSTPHSFLIQGPPGTGKSTVITELVMQLTRRGERILLLAPMHVAVDEVLGRIADQPGVFAMRIAGDDSKVRQDLLRLLPEQVAQEYLRAARTPETSQTDAWRAQLSRLDIHDRLIGAYLEATAREDSLRGARSATETSYAAWSTENDQQISAAMKRLDRADEALASIAPAESHARAYRTGLRAQLDAVPTLSRWLSRARAWFGQSDTFTALVNAHGAAAAAHERILHDQRLWGNERVSADAEASRLRHAQAARYSGHVAAIAELEGQERTARQDRQDAAAALHDATGLDVAAHGVDNWRADHGRVHEWIRRLQQRITLERRWFELSGLSSPEGEVAGLAQRFETELRQSANVVCATTTGVVSADLGDADFDTLIVDEASRVVDSEFLIGAVRARRWLLVGDQQQLPPYVEQADEHHLHALTALHLAQRETLDTETAVAKLALLWQEEEAMHKFRLTSVEQTAVRLGNSGHWGQYRRAFQRHLLELGERGQEPERTVMEAMRRHLVRSLFERCAEAMPEGQFAALRLQHRSIEPIAALVRDSVYKGRYDTPEDSSEVRPLVVPSFGTPVVFANTSAKGTRAADELVGHGFINRLEAAWVRNICVQLDRAVDVLGETDVSVSVLTFYKHQATRIKQALGHPRYDGFPALDFRKVDVIDRIQGQESDVVIISFCRARPGGQAPQANYGAWLQDLRRLNVAVTRARRGLFLVGHGETLRRLRGVPAAEEFYRQLFQRIQTMPAEITMVQDL